VIAVALMVGEAAALDDGVCNIVRVVAASSDRALEAWVYGVAAKRGGDTGLDAMRAGPSSKLTHRVRARRVCRTPKLPSTSTNTSA
jgi:hypothetical protein